MGLNDKNICVYFDEPIGLVRVDRNGSGYTPLTTRQYQCLHDQSGGLDGRALAAWVNETLGLSPYEVDQIISQSMNNALGE